MEVWLSRLPSLVFFNKSVSFRRDDHILTNLARMGENARKAVKDTLAELQYIVAWPRCAEVLDDVVAEVCGKHERVLTPLARDKSLPVVPLRMSLPVDPRIAAPELVETTCPELSIS